MKSLFNAFALLALLSFTSSALAQNKLSKCIKIDEAYDLEIGNQGSDLQTAIATIFESAVDADTQIDKAVKEVVRKEELGRSDLAAQWGVGAFQFQLVHRSEGANLENMTRDVIEEYLMYHQYSYSHRSGTVTYSPYFVRVEVQYSIEDDEPTDEAVIREHHIRFLELCEVN